MTKQLLATSCALFLLLSLSCAPTSISATDGGSAGNSTGGGGSNGGGSTSPTPGPGNPNFLYGVTIVDIADINNTVTSLSKLAVKATTRIVFDEGMPASYYTAAAASIHNVSFVMGEILDSFYVKDLSVLAYKNRTIEYLDALGNNVDIWEIGNEINGEWLGTTADVVAKMNAAYTEVKARGKKTALTLYYNEDCWATSTNEVFTWAQKNVSAAMKQGLDYVLLSYYEDDCNDLQPNWPVIFRKLAVMFPNSKIGFGEVGTIYTERKASYMNRYYNMVINEPNYIGGYFWWYFFQDCVPYTKPLWNVFNQAIQ